MSEDAQTSRPLTVTLHAMGRGLLLRCPRCGEGRMPRSLFGIGGACAVCGLQFELGAGDFSGAIMIAQMLLGLLAIPVWILLSLLTEWTFTVRVVVAVGVLLLLLLVFYRNVKGLWCGFLVTADRVQTAAANRR